jgi:hypothetical protein
MARFRLSAGMPKPPTLPSTMRYHALGNRVSLALQGIVDPADFEFGLQDARRRRGPA